jgi:hypothetical protein
MSNSKLVSYTGLSPNHSGKRTSSISRITPHAVVGQLSVERICDCFRTEGDRQAATMPSALTAESAFALMKLTAPGAHHPAITINVLSPSNVPLL